MSNTATAPPTSMDSPTGVPEDNVTVDVIKAVIAALGFDLWYHNGGRAGYTYFDKRRISLRRGMSEEKIRSTLAHETFHAMFGTFLREDEDAEEELVEWLASRWLIQRATLVDIAAREMDLESALAFAGTDHGLLRARVERAATDDPTAGWAAVLERFTSEREGLSA